MDVEVPAEATAEELVMGAGAWGGGWLRSRRRELELEELEEPRLRGGTATEIGVKLV
eukprot:SAG11_NODE_22833_length_398_cov_1.006667_1_plen_57_part_00